MLGIIDYIRVINTPVATGDGPYCSRGWSQEVEVEETRRFRRPQKLVIGHISNPFAMIYPGIASFFYQHTRQITNDTIKGSKFQDSGPLLAPI